MPQEIECFRESIDCAAEQLTSCNLLTEAPSQRLLDQHDVVLVGGSGDYSATTDLSEDGTDWLERALGVLRRLYESRKPTFASCWGFQAMSRALGGTVVKDPANAELGTLSLTLTEAGQRDPLFSQLESPFVAQLGHEDRVTELPPSAVLLASSDKVKHQAFCFPGRMLYATQFHPELSMTRFLERVRAYPQYIEQITGQRYDDFVADCRETPESSALIPRFIELVAQSITPVNTDDVEVAKR